MAQISVVSVNASIVNISDKNQKAEHLITKTLSLYNKAKLIAIRYLEMKSSSV